MSYQSEDTVPTIPPIRKPEDDPIGYLCGRRFPLARNAGVEFGSSLSYADRQIFIKQAEDAEAYRIELEALPPEKLSELFRDERVKQIQQQKLQEQAKENSRSFNLSASKADIEHYAKLRYWNIEEGIALIHGKSPEYANWESIKPCVNISTFAKTFERAKQIADRAVGIKELGQTNLPGFFIAWAKRMNFPVPLELENEVAKYGPIVDWRGHCETLNSQVSRLTERIKELEAVQPATPAALPPWGKHDTTLLKHLAAAADRFWTNYDPSDNTTAPKNSEIVDWLEGRGVAKRTAEAMATILRADGLPTGPRT